MDVRFPELRARIRTAAHALHDEQLHERLWLRGSRESTAELGFDDTLLVFVDERDMFGPGDLVGNVLVDERESAALDAVRDAVLALIDRIGSRGSFQDAVVTDEVWQRCKGEAAQLDLLLNRP